LLWNMLWAFVIKQRKSAHEAPLTTSLRRHLLL